MENEEYFDIIDTTGSIVGKATRRECHSDNSLAHQVVHVLVFNSSGELFLQKRSMNLAFTDGSTTGWTAFFEPKEDTWYHTAISYDGTWVRTYVDGKEVYASKDWDGKEINQGISRIGGHAPGGDCFEGIIDEVALFDAALPEADIKSLMTDWRSIAPLDKAASIWGNIKSRAIQ